MNITECKNCKSEMNQVAQVDYLTVYFCKKCGSVMCEFFNLETIVEEWHLIDKKEDDNDL